MKRIAPGYWRVTLKGRTFDVIRHDARNTSGKAWSSYEVGEDENEPVTMQTRTRQEQLDDLDALVKP